MKTIFFLVAAFCWTTALQAQNSWKVIHNGRQKLQAAAESTVKNVLLFRRSDLKAGGALQVSFTEPKKQKDWQRVIAVFDDKDNELLQQTGNALKIDNANLDALAKTAKVIKIFTWSLPTDPNMAAAVRVRRVHLCTLIIK